MKVAFELFIDENAQSVVMEKVAAITKQTAELGFKFNGVEVIGQDKLGNFEIQDLLSRYNQAERLASAIMANLCSTYVGMVGKI